MLFSFQFSWIFDGGGGQRRHLLSRHVHTVIRFGRVSAKFGTCTVVSVNETVVE
jgi:hypothetical protein